MRILYADDNRKSPTKSDPFSCITVAVRSEKHKLYTAIQHCNKKEIQALLNHLIESFWLQQILLPHKPSS